MIIEDKIIVKNYKCFDETGGGFDRIMPINILIGKNNSGKSALIDLVGFLTKHEKHSNGNNLIDIGRNNHRSEVIITHKLLQEELEIIFKPDVGSIVPSQWDIEYGKKFIMNEYSYSIQSSGRRNYKSISEYKESNHKVHSLVEELASVMSVPMSDKEICLINAERDIVPESNNEHITIKSDGAGTTNTIQQLINDSKKDSNLIEYNLLEELNKIVYPDIRFSRILCQKIETNRWEIYFEDTDKNKIALSKMGSGIKTVLLVLMNLLIRHKIEEDKSPNSYVYAFEELENNLHPALQRRLYDYINEYSKKHKAYFFLTTHSNVVIDSFAFEENAQLIHVQNDGIRSTVSSVSSYTDSKNVINDLGLKASDILQSNGVIWVEGPSDRNYINKWLSVLAPELKEGLHYSIMFYGGRLLANLSFDYEWFDISVIPLIKINQNAYVVMDRDGKNISTKLNATKKRIIEEIGDSSYWITRGREIENYLSDDTVTNWLNNKHSYTVDFENTIDQKIEKTIEETNVKIKIKYNESKTKYSSEICEYISEESIKQSRPKDLEKKLNELIEQIRKWNK